MTRKEIDPGDLQGETIESFEYVPAEESAPDAAYIVIRFTNGATLYADNPTAYADES